MHCHGLTWLLIGLWLRSYLPVLKLKTYVESKSIQLARRGSACDQNLRSNQKPNLFQLGATKNLQNYSNPLPLSSFTREEDKDSGERTHYCPEVAIS